MQRKMAQAQDELAVETVEASAGGGIVTVVDDRLARGASEVRINPDAVDPEDVEMLQDLVVAATNEALRAAQDLASAPSSAAPPAASTCPTSPACSERASPWRRADQRRCRRPHAGQMRPRLLGRAGLPRRVASG